MIHTIELPAKIDKNHQIHLQLPESISEQEAKVLVMYEKKIQSSKPIKYDLFKGKIKMSADFNDSDE